MVAGGPDEDPAAGPGPCPAGLRLLLQPAVRLLQRVPAGRRAGRSRRRPPPRGLPLRVSEPRLRRRDPVRAGAPAEQGDHHPLGLPDAARAVQVGSRPPGGPSPPPLRMRLGRPRDHEQRLHGRRPEPPGRRRRRRLVRAADGCRQGLLRVDADPGTRALAQPAHLPDLPVREAAQTSSCSTRG